MRKRGTVFWEWANPTLHFRNYDQLLPSNTLINVQARLSSSNVTQLFIGIYGDRGVMLYEEYFPDCIGQTITAAMAWGLQRANDWVSRKKS